MPRQVLLNARTGDVLGSLPTLLAVADAGSLARAARQLGVTKSAVSQALAHAEALLGVRLFDRNSRGARLTDAGARFLADIRSPLAQLNAARERLDESVDAVRGRLRLTAPYVAFEWLLLPALRRLASVHPELRVEVELEDRFVDIVRQGYDAGIRLGDAVQRDMVGVTISDASACALVASPAYLAQHGTPTTAADLQHHRCVGFALHGAVHPWEIGDAASPTSRLMVPAALTVNGIAQTIQAARSGLGVAYAVPRGLVHGDIVSGALVELTSISTITVPPMMLYYPSSRLVPPGVAALRDALLAEKGDA